MSTFVRMDGTPIGIFEYHVDGIVTADPVSVQFRLPDGSVIARTEFASDAVVRCSSAGLIEIYRFGTTFIPIASRVYRFDGYKLADVTSISSRALAAHSYRSSLARLRLVARFGCVRCRIVVRCWPHPASRMVLMVRGLGLGFVRVASGLYLLMLLWFAPLSAPILLLGAASYVALRRAFIRTKVA